MLDYQKVYDRLAILLKTNLDDIDIEGNISVSDLDNIIGYCRITDIYYMEELARKLEKRLLKKDYLPGKFGGFEYDCTTGKMVLTLEYALGKQEKYIFTKLNNGDIILIDATYRDKGQKLLPIIGDYLHKLIDYKIKVNDFKTLNARKIKSVDDNFMIDMVGDVITITGEGFRVKLSYDEYNCDKQDIECDSLEISKLLSSNLDRILKRVRVDINDCPKWMQEELTNINKKALKKKEDRNKIKKIFKR